MCAAGNIERNAKLLCIQRTLYGSGGDIPSAFYQPRSHGEADGSDLFSAKRLIFKLSPVFGFVGEQDDSFIDRPGFKKVFGPHCAFVKQLLRQQIVFLHREAMPARKIVAVNRRESYF